MIACSRLGWLVIRKLAIVGLFVVLPLATACSDSNAPSATATAWVPSAASTSVAPPSAAARDETELREYLDDVNAAFGDMETEGIALRNTLAGTPTSEAEYFANWVAFARAGSHLAAGMLVKLEGLDPPNEMQAWHARAVAFYRTTGDTYDEAARAATAHDQEALQDASNALQALSEGEAVALDQEWNRIGKEVFPGRPTRPLGQP
jgi:hypothetical protein